MEVLPKLFGEIHIPRGVHSELVAPGAPQALREWLDKIPEWLRIHEPPEDSDRALSRLHLGEAEVIALAKQLSSDLVVLDDRAARAVAASLGLNLTGLLGVLDSGAGEGYLDLLDAVRRLRTTNFRIAPALLRRLVQRYSEQG
ncbi:MAG: DUF3368 domain-containing protein [Deltaproteobacteria bacterium]|nr:DUF3368 domain-containing protein [Deltaproteobacteria bacterium]